MPDNVPADVPPEGAQSDAPYGVKADGTPRAKPGRKPGQASGTGTRRRTSTKSASIQSEVAGLVQFTNLIVTMTPYKDDALSPDEAAMLTDALVEEVNANPVIVRWFNRAGKVLPHVKLINAVFAIAWVRLIKHGKIPPVNGTVGAPVSVASGGALFDDWGHGNGQINPNGESGPVPFVRSDGTD